MLLGYKFISGDEIVGLNSKLQYTLSDMFRFGGLMPDSDGVQLRHGRSLLVFYIGELVASRCLFGCWLPAFGLSIAADRVSSWARKGGRPRAP